MSTDAEKFEINRVEKGGEVTYAGMVIVGTCSACGGPMVIPAEWKGSPEVHPRARCGECGRERKGGARWGPVIEVAM